MAYITDADRLFIIEQTPLVAIDLIIKNSNGEFLLGLRKKNPARNKWFVPGGCIKKDESLSKAFGRITEAEIGRSLDRENATFLGVFEHKYNTNYQNTEGITTHYIVLAYEILLDVKLSSLPIDQHSQWKYESIKNIIEDERVHKYTKDYFKPEFPI